MPSTQTRSKLKAFQFIEGAPTVETRKEREAEKENGHIDPRRRETPKKSNMTRDTDHNTSETPKLVHAKTCPLLPPSTPATRLPLADLVGNIDDSNRHAMKAMVSPEEQLGWRGSQPVNTPIPRKSKKRARSSSPAVPSQEEPRMDSIRRDLNTPQPDPATELWTRYTSNKGTPTASKNVAFAHLINESSPRSSATAGSVSGLRRWASCGVEFPASHTKKRRTKGTFRAETEPTGDVFGAASSDGTFQAQPEQSKLAGMLQRMRESITKQESSKICSSELPSSSSPLPEARERHFAPESSPLRHHAQDESAQSSQTMQAEMEAIEEEVAQEEEALVEPARSSSSSDEFGDADFDTEMIEVLEISQQLPPQYDTYTPLPAQPVNSVHPPPFQSAVLAADDDGSDDEFGIDEDLFAADLEQVASLYDIRPEMTSTENQDISVRGTGNDAMLHSAAPPVINLVDDDSDDFGDDIDVDEFAAAEVAATQSGSNVRRS
jgi:DNA replication ATP-dependent helicase Dna2